ncbi:23S rRNA (guanosine(2251)-2'-O)-methyltransferase RlmB [Halorhodospira halochloris]|uniref:23S rRNA (Guanosine-2'-O-)-methyltransferase rlmB n=1 Tax=Halorhodospira halochloris TaxID=1052 RepID=A0A0X8X7V8_HALHR|nr:23S rRNA (guanosine(2251)-2'-O)-methyltransferase RlmB [Halorhodospira halochloris]MBK1651535.1 23S rRNA (guanosine(2251)-2'-O)-methyltransferase RlmB [Halorhodospira halochloris]MCG5530965.1 23S rRNA (guanosine(2251)-2'-O)-methyltransferase RlmB [Halorhodospira halochloris]BAU57201.1 23S rRNA (guanosine-2'-O-) -methyltransferase rlmB [Halorhodospira halochloris]
MANRLGSEAEERAKSHSLIYGRHPVREAATYDPAGVVAIWVDQALRRDPKLERLFNKLKKQGVTFYRVKRRELDEMVGGANHQGVVLSYRGAAVRGEAELNDLLDSARDPLLLVLDRVQDPHNLGACLRSAAAAGAAGVVAPRDHAASLSPAVHKVAAGAVQSVPFFQVTNLARALANMQQAGLVTIGAAGDGAQTLYSLELRGAIALVMGGESEGLRRLTRKNCDYVAAIPMPGSIESLNVAVAAGVVLFEAVRQRSNC